MMIEKNEKKRGIVGWKTSTRMAWSVFVFIIELPRGNNSADDTGGDADRTVNALDVAVNKL
ncbi:MAG: hypothetical protein A2Z94_04550 [Gallionellales bacterium GWA2_55_18]|nr:MAG: hypothetical protein A2Z94_04550 [Gallionellales bacterium GWA2_55_18]